MMYKIYTHHIIFQQKLNCRERFCLHLASCSCHQLNFTIIYLIMGFLWLQVLLVKYRTKVNIGNKWHTPGRPYAALWSQLHTYCTISQKLNKMVYQTGSMTLLGDFCCAENRTGGAASRFLKWQVSRGFGDVTSFIGANGFFFRIQFFSYFMF